MLGLKNLKRIAHSNVVKEIKTLEDLQEFLVKWRSKTYNLPANHPLLTDITLEELVIEYFECIFKENEKYLRDFEYEECDKKILDIDGEQEWYKNYRAQKDKNKINTNDKKNHEDIEDNYTIGK